MHKLVILIGPVADTEAFQEGWPRFLHHAEEMPGLLREASSQVRSRLYGGAGDFRMIHELFFESPEALEAAMRSSHGKAAGEILQDLTGGQMTLLTADHTEDAIENIRSYRQSEAADADS